MKITRTLTLLLLGVFVATLAIAQTGDNRPLTKKEKKEWKKKKKKMSPEDFRIMYEENIAQKATIASIENSMSGLEAQATANEAELLEMQKQMTRVQAAYQAAQRELEQVKAQKQSQPAYNPAVINGEDFSRGVVFKVQVGAFRKVDLAKYAETSKDFNEEEMQELRRYVIGNFRNYEDANVLKRYLREMGVQDAWIVPYKENRRVPLKEVLDEAAASN